MTRLNWPSLIMDRLSLAVSTAAQGVPPVCKPVLDAEIRVATTRPHTVSTETDRRTVGETLTVDGANYVKIRGKWTKSSMTPQDDVGRPHRNIKDATFGAQRQPSIAISLPDGRLDVRGLGGWIMFSPPFVTIALAAALAAGCSKPATPPTAAAQTTSRAQAAAAQPGNACDRHLVTEDDVAGILRDPIARMKSLATDGDPQSCEFETAGFASITIALRPGLGNTTVDTWASGRMPAAATPLANVGDRAVWVATLREVVATKNNLLCDIGVGGAPTASQSDDVIRQRLGGLCNKIFAHP